MNRLTSDQSPLTNEHDDNLIVDKEQLVLEVMEELKSSHQAEIDDLTQSYQNQIDQLLLIIQQQEEKINEMANFNSSTVVPTSNQSTRVEVETVKQQMDNDLFKSEPLMSPTSVQQPVPQTTIVERDFGHEDGNNFKNYSHNGVKNNIPNPYKTNNTHVRHFPSAQEVFPLPDAPPTGQFTCFIPPPPPNLVVKIHQGQSELDLLKPDRVRSPSTTILPDRPNSNNNINNNKDSFPTSPSKGSFEKYIPSNQHSLTTPTIQKTRPTTNSPHGVGNINDLPLISRQKTPSFTQRGRRSVGGNNNTANQPTSVTHVLHLQPCYSPNPPNQINQSVPSPCQTDQSHHVPLTLSRSNSQHRQPQLQHQQNRDLLPTLPRQRSALSITDCNDPSVDTLYQQPRVGGRYGGLLIDVTNEDRQQDSIQAQEPAVATTNSGLLTCLGLISSPSSLNNMQTSTSFSIRGGLVDNSTPTPSKKKQGGFSLFEGTLSLPLQQSHSPHPPHPPQQPQQHLNPQSFDQSPITTSNSFSFQGSQSQVGVFAKTSTTYGMISNPPSVNYFTSKSSGFNNNNDGNDQKKNVNHQVNKPLGWEIVGGESTTTTTPRHSFTLTPHQRNVPPPFNINNLPCPSTTSANSTNTTSPQSSFFVPNTNTSNTPGNLNTPTPSFDQSNSFSKIYNTTPSQQQSQCSHSSQPSPLHLPSHSFPLRHSLNLYNDEGLAPTRLGMGSEGVVKEDLGPYNNSPCDQNDQYEPKDGNNKIPSSLPASAISTSFDRDAAFRLERDRSFSSRVSVPTRPTRGGATQPRTSG